MTPPLPRTPTWSTLATAVAWGTIAAAVVSALLLAVLLQPGLPDEGNGKGRAKMALPSDAKAPPARPQGADRASVGR
jgi:hypothetical protein